MDYPVNGLIASDVTNTEYQGAVNDPDAALGFEFVREAVEDTWETQNSERNPLGVPIYREKWLLKVTIPGPPETKVVVSHAVDPDDPSSPVNNHVRTRFRRQWEHFLSQYQRGTTLTMAGTSLDEWPLLNLGVKATLRGAGFQTVEQIATASDHQLNSMGMGLGMSAAEARQKSRDFLAERAQAVVAEEQGGIHKQLADQSEIIKQLQAQIEALQQPKVEEVKRGPGRPPHQPRTVEP
jgi:hypothetical protein